MWTQVEVKLLPNNYCRFGTKHAKEYAAFLDKRRKLRVLSYWIWTVTHILKLIFETKESLQTTNVFYVSLF